MRNLLNGYSEVDIQGDELSIPRARRRAHAPTLAKISTKYHEHNGGIYSAYATGAYSYREIAEYYGLHLATVGRVIQEQMLQYEN
jgi:DNA invertase Pin-like site-specific DNA recombinase